MLRLPRKVIFRQHQMLHVARAKKSDTATSPNAAPASKIHTPTSQNGAPATKSEMWMKVMWVMRQNMLCETWVMSVMCRWRWDVSEKWCERRVMWVRGDVGCEWCEWKRMWHMSDVRCEMWVIEMLVMWWNVVVLKLCNSGIVLIIENK